MPSCCKGKKQILCNTISRSHADRVRTFLLMTIHFGMSLYINVFPFTTKV